MPDVFISYSRKNLDFVKQLVAALENEGKEVWWDQKKEALEGIMVGSPWWEQIKIGIEEADNFLFVISPNSIVSPYCHAEINHARRQGKRLITALYCGWISEPDTWDAIGAAIDATPSEDVLPDEVAREPVNFRSLVRQNWLSLNEIQHAIFTGSIPFEEPFAHLINALDLDFAWVRMRNRLRQAATLWDENDRSDGYLWSDEQLKPFYEMIERRQPDLSDLELDFIRPECEQLVEKLNNVSLEHYRREGIGLRLEAIGDCRKGVGLDQSNLPDIVWCTVGEGQTFQVERDGIIYQVKTPFYIAKYPVTYRQFQAFVDARDGFQYPVWWKELKVRDSQKKKPGNQHLNVGNHPRTNVGWYDAIAFSRWLSVKLGYQITLPTEQQWYIAATLGDTTRDYPWGAWDSRFANTKESGLNRMVAVGMYPQGKSPNNVFDMSGNIWEWCINVQDKGLDYKPLRGGTWDYDLTAAKCSHRKTESPGKRHNRYGFRLCCTAPPESALTP